MLRKRAFSTGSNDSAGVEENVHTFSESDVDFALSEEQNPNFSSTKYDPDTLRRRPTVATTTSQPTSRAVAQQDSAERKTPIHTRIQQRTPIHERIEPTRARAPSAAPSMISIVSHQSNGTVVGRLPVSRKASSMWRAEGWLYLRSSGLRKTWKRRWCAYNVKQGVLYSFRSRTDRTVCGKFPIEYYRIVAHPPSLLALPIDPDCNPEVFKKGKRYAYLLEFVGLREKKHYRFAANFAYEIRSWLEAFWETDSNGDLEILDHSSHKKSAEDLLHKSEEMEAVEIDTVEQQDPSVLTEAERRRKRIGRADSEGRDLVAHAEAPEPPREDNAEAASSRAGEAVPPRRLPEKPDRSRSNVDEESLRLLEVTEKLSESMGVSRAPTPERNMLSLSERELLATQGGGEAQASFATSQLSHSQQKSATANGAAATVAEHSRGQTIGFQAEKAGTTSTAQAARSEETPVTLRQSTAVSPHLHVPVGGDTAVQPTLPSPVSPSHRRVSAVPVDPQRLSVTPFGRGRASSVERRRSASVQAPAPSAQGLKYQPFNLAQYREKMKREAVGHEEVDMSAPGSATFVQHTVRAPRERGLTRMRSRSEVLPSHSAAGRGRARTAAVPPLQTASTDADAAAALREFERLFDEVRSRENEERKQVYLAEAQAHRRRLVTEAGEMVSRGSARNIVKVHDHETLEDQDSLVATAENRASLRTALDSHNDLYAQARDRGANAAGEVPRTASPPPPPAALHADDSAPKGPHRTQKAPTAAPAVPPGIPPSPFASVPRQAGPISATGDVPSKPSQKMPAGIRAQGLGGAGAATQAREGGAPVRPSLRKPVQVPSWSSPAATRTEQAKDLGKHAAADTSRTVHPAAGVQRGDEANRPVGLASAAGSASSMAATVDDSDAAPRVSPDLAQSAVAPARQSVSELERLQAQLAATMHEDHALLARLEETRRREQLIQERIRAAEQRVAGPRANAPAHAAASSSKPHVQRDTQVWRSPRGQPGDDLGELVLSDTEAHGDDDDDDDDIDDNAVADHQPSKPHALRGSARPGVVHEETGTNAFDVVGALNAANTDRLNSPLSQTNSESMDSGVHNAGDALKLERHAKIRALFTEYGDREVYFSDFVRKMNKRGSTQRRILLITDRAMYNLHPRTLKLKRRIDFRAIDEIRVSTKSNEFAVIVSSEWDYLLSSERRPEILLLFREAYARCVGSELRVNSSASKHLYRSSRALVLSRHDKRSSNVHIVGNEDD